MAELKSRHAFGSEANIEAALAAGAIDAHDILFLNEGKIGWIDKEGKPIILEGKKQIVPVSTFPNTGEEGVIYVYNNQLYLWDEDKQEYVIVSNYVADITADDIESLFV